MEATNQNKQTKAKTDPNTDQSHLPKPQSSTPGTVGAVDPGEPAKPDTRNMTTDPVDLGDETKDLQENQGLSHLNEYINSGTDHLLEHDEHDSFENPEKKGFVYTQKLAQEQPKAKPPHDVVNAATYNRVQAEKFKDIMAQAEESDSGTAGETAEKAQEMKEKAAHLGGTIKEKAEGALETVAAIPGISPIIDATKYVVHTAVDTAVGAKDYVVDTAVGAKDYVVDTAVGAKDYVVDTAVGAKDYVVDTAVGAKDYVVHTVEAVLGTEFTDQAKEKAEDVSEKAKDAKEKAKDTVNDAKEKAKETAKDIKEKATETANDVKEKAKETVNVAKENVANAGIVGATLNYVSETIEAAKEIIGETAHQIKETVLSTVPVVGGPEETDFPQKPDETRRTVENVEETHK